MNALAISKKIFFKSAPNLRSNTMGSDFGGNVGVEMFVIEFYVFFELEFGKIFQKRIAFFIKGTNSIGILFLFAV